MSEGWPLEPSDLEYLRALLPALSDAELDTLAPRPSDEFGIAFNLVLYSHFASALSRGVLFVVEELEAKCGYRDDLDTGVASLADTALRSQVIEALDLIDKELLACTVSRTPKWTRPPGSDGWWWDRTPRRTDQRLYLEDRWEVKMNIPEHIQRRYDAWEQSGDERPFAEWSRASRASGDE